MELIPFSQLKRSPDNTRRTDKKADIDSLAASIAAHGLLHNLVVKRNSKDYEVVDGERRLLAIKKLLDAAADGTR